MNDTTGLRLLDLELAVSAAVAAHPDWLFPILRAATAGIEAALERSEQRRATCELAALAAMSLASPGRVNDDARQALNDVVVRAINPRNASAVERRFVDRAKA